MDTWWSAEDNLSHFQEKKITHGKSCVAAARFLPVPKLPHLKLGWKSINNSENCTVSNSDAFPWMDFISTVSTATEKQKGRRKLPSLSIQILNNSLAYASQVTPRTHAVNCSFAVEVLTTKQLLNTKTISRFHHCCPLGEEKYWEDSMNLLSFWRLNSPSKVCPTQCDI